MWHCGRPFLAVGGEAGSAALRVVLFEAPLGHVLVSFVLDAALVDVLALQVGVRRVGIFDNFDAQAHVVGVARIGDRFVRKFKGTIVLACASSREHTVQSRVLVVAQEFRLRVIKGDFKKSKWLVLRVFSIFLVDLGVVWDEDFQLLAHGWLALERRVKDRVQDVEALLHLVLRDSRNRTKCLGVPGVLYLTRFPGTPDDCVGDHVDFERLIEHEVLL